MPPIIEARGISAGYGHIPVTRKIDLHVEAGEVVVLLGVNGAGKTTTLLTLAGEVPPSEGELLWNGEPLHGPLHARAKRGVRFVTEERSVFMGLTAWDNLKLGRGSPDKALELFPELKRLLKRKAGLLSGGEQQILTLARALSGKPTLLLADELSLGLAPRVVGRLLAAVRAAADDGVAVILVEQQVRQALSIADRGYLMHRGRIVLRGTASELKDRIADIEASYLSGMDVADNGATADGRLATGASEGAERPTSAQTPRGTM